MNEYSRELMHMTTAEKAAYNREYYQRNKQYWVDYYKTGHGIGRAVSKIKEYGKPTVTRTPNYNDANTRKPIISKTGVTSTPKVKLSEKGYKDRDQKPILRDRYDWEENRYIPTHYSKNFYEDRMNRPRQAMIPNPNYEKEQREKEREHLKKHIRDAAPWISEPALDVIARTGHQVYTTARSYINSIPDLKKSLSGVLGQASSRVKSSIDTGVKWLKSKWG